MLRPLYQISNSTELVAQTLRDQNDLTAVERFSQWHESAVSPEQETHYRHLIPLSRPQAGQQYAFEVDLDCCTGCKACVTACHNLNGLDDDETWRDVGLLVGQGIARPYQQTVTTACHHCVEPGCMLGCPVNAYEKDPVTGIVKHLDDQCIGCQYCTLTCPYDVPKYNTRLGIVRKCDMCSQRLSDGEAPACVQACPNQAIQIKVVNQAEMTERRGATTFLAGSPDPAHTKPTTRYVTRKIQPRDVHPADFAQEQPKHAHWPLVLMLVLIQLSVGTFIISLLTTSWDSIVPRDRWLAGGAWISAALALGVCLLHLGRPQYAFRAVLGLRHSWLSREILTFGGYAKIAAVYVALLCLSVIWNVPATLIFTCGLLTVGVGLAGIFCSIMVYHVTTKPAWKGGFTAMRFLGTVCCLGPSFAAGWQTVIAAGDQSVSVGCVVFTILATGAKLAAEFLLWRNWQSKPAGHPLQQTAVLMSGPLQRARRLHFSLGLWGGVYLPLLSLLMQTMVVRGFVLILGFGFLLAAEICERYLFFRSVCAEKMPGNPVS